MDESKIVLVVTLFLGGLMVGIGMLAIALFEQHISCPMLAKEIGLEYKYNYVAGGCFVKMENGSWIDSDKYRGILE